MRDDADTDAVYQRLATELGRLGLLYLHLVDQTASTGGPQTRPDLERMIRERFAGPVILSGGYGDARRAEADLVEGKGDLIAFGRPFISNPTLVDKLRTGAPLTPPDAETFFTPGSRGYTDYV